MIKGLLRCNNNALEAERHFTSHLEKVEASSLYFSFFLIKPESFSIDNTTQKMKRARDSSTAHQWVKRFEDKSKQDKTSINAGLGLDPHQQPIQ